MRRVMIVDDERLIREGLRTLIDWEASGFSVVALACDGREALELQAASPVDLIVCDIRMPRVDGLELLTALRARGDGVHFVLLTGFAEFEYARRAVALGADGYLLKPVDEVELVSLVGQVAETLNRAPTVAELLAGTAGEGAGTEGRWQVVVLGFPGRPEGPTTTEAEVFTAEVRRRGLGEGFVSGRELGVLLRQVYPGGRNLEVLVRHLEAALEPALGPGTTFFGGLGPVVSSSVDIPPSARTARSRLARGFFVGPGALVWDDLEPGPRPDLAPWSEALGLALATGLADRIEAVVGALIEALAATASEAVVKEGLAQVLGPRPWVVDLWSQPSLSALEDLAKARLVDDAAGLARPGAQGLVERLQHIIAARYADPLKLETLAQVLGYNAAYLGKLFRAHTGSSFNAALDRVRIDRAQELLAQGYKVYEVASMVGFRYVDYFHAKFKKVTGKAPSLYKH